MPQAAITKTQPTDGNKIKRSVVRVLGLSIITSGIYNFYWFFVTKNQLKRELKNEQHVGWQTVGLIVPVLNAFVLYWLYRDINRVRETQKLPAFPAAWYVLIPIVLIGVAFLIGAGAIISIVGAIGSAVNSNNDAALGLAGAGVITGLFAILMLFTAGILQYVFIGLAISKLNQFWDKRTGGKAVAAGWGKGEIAVVVVGVIVMILNWTGNGAEQKRFDANDFSIDTSETTPAPGTDKDDASQPGPQQIYDQVQTGMSKDQVRQIAGRGPNDESVSEFGGTKLEIWTYRRGTGFITITFTDGAVSSKSSF